MADDVRSFLSYPLNYANSSNSQAQFLQPHSKTMTLRQVMMEVSRIAVVPTRTTRVLTRTSRPSLNLRSEKNSTPITTVAPAKATQKWKMQTATGGESRNDRRRSRRQRIERTLPATTTTCMRVSGTAQGGETSRTLTECFHNPSIFRCTYLILP